jgi:hypothetical protein
VSSSAFADKPLKLLQKQRTDAMDFYRAPTAVGQPSVQSSSSTMPLSRPGLISDASPSSNAIFNETFTQPRALNGVLPQQQLQKSNSQHQQNQVSAVASAIILQQTLKKNVLAKPAAILNRPVSSNQSQRGEVKESPRWVPGHYKDPVKPTNRSVTPQKLKILQIPQQNSNIREYLRTSSAPGLRPGSKTQKQTFCTRLGESNLYSLSGMDDYSCHRSIPLSVNTLHRSFPSRDPTPHSAQADSIFHYGNGYQSISYHEEEMLRATTYSDSQFQMCSVRANEESDNGNDLNEDDTNGYDLANIYSIGGSPDLPCAHNATDLEVSARRNPTLKFHSLKLNSLRAGPTKGKISAESLAVKKRILEQSKRPNPLQRSKSAPIQRPNTNKLPVKSSSGRILGDLQPAQRLHTVTNSYDKELRESMLSWSKRQARDKRIGTNYFGNTKKGAQLIQGQPLLPSGNHSGSHLPQQRPSAAESAPILKFSKPLALRKSFALSQSQESTLAKLGSNQGGKLKTPTPAATITTVASTNFFEFQMASKTTDVATARQSNGTNPTLHLRSANDNTSVIGGRAMQPQQQLNLDSQLLKYQLQLQHNRTQPPTNQSYSGPALGGKPAVSSSSSLQQQKFQVEYLARRHALLAMPINEQVRLKPILQHAPNASHSNSFEFSPSRPCQMSSESYESVTSPNGQEEITDKAEWHRFRSWLESIGMEHYLSLMRDNGVSKLSILELLTGDDLAQIGISEMDAAIILQKSRQLTEQIKSFSENADFVSWSTASHNGGAASSRLTTATSFLRTKETNYFSRVPEPPGSASAVPLVAENIMELKEKLVQSYKSGDLEKFFELWERLPNLPIQNSQSESNDLDMLLRSERPSLVSAKRMMEFHFYLYFFVFFLKHAGFNKIPLLKAKSALRNYLDKIANNQHEYQSLNSSNKASSSISTAQAFQQLNPMSSSEPMTKAFSGDVPATIQALSSIQASLQNAKNLYSTSEFATFAGLVFVPNPETNPAFQSLFRDEWSTDLQEILEKFLDALLPEETVKAEENITLHHPQSHLEISQVSGDQARDICASPASSISQLTDDTPLNRVTASLSGQYGQTHGNHTMEAWLQSQSSSTVTGQRHVRANPGFGSPANISGDHNSARRIVVGTLPPTSVRMPLNQRNLLSIRQQQQLQQFHQQFGYAPISPGGSRVSGGRSASQWNNNSNVNNPLGSHTPLDESPGDILVSALDQISIPHVAFPSQAHSSSIQPTGVPTSPIASAHEGTNNTDGFPLPSRPKPAAASQSSAKSSLQSQVDNYNRLLKLKKLPRKSSQPAAQPNQQSVLAEYSILTSEEDTKVVISDNSSALGKVPINTPTKENTTNDKDHIVAQEIDKRVAIQYLEVEPVVKVDVGRDIREHLEQDTTLEMHQIGNGDGPVEEAIKLIPPAMEDIVAHSFLTPTGVAAISLSEDRKF